MKMKGIKNMVKSIQRSDWTSKFTLIGKPVINDKYTYKMNQRSEKSNWIYNSLNLGVDCGERAGTVYCELMGGYSENNENRIYAHGKDENGNDDYKKSIVVDWNDRFNDDILDEIGRTSFIAIKLEKTNKGELFKKNFLSAYDAIEYVKEHLTPDMTIRVSGNLKYSMYNDVVKVQKIINYIELSDANTPSANFVQTILIDRNSTGLKSENIDKDKGVIYVNARVLDYVKEINGVEVKGQYPYNKQFEFPMDFSNQELCKKIMDKLFKVKKGVTQITFEGNFIESGAAIMPTFEELPDEIKELVVLGLYNEEDVLNQCRVNGSRERRMVLKAPATKMVGDDDNKVLVVQRFEKRYTEDDLILDFMINDESDDEVPFEAGSSGGSDMEWLNAL